VSTELAVQNGSTNRIVPVTGGQRGLQLTNLDEMWRFATAVAKSGLAPKGIETPEAIFVALQMGAELGLSPMASLQNIAVINGRPAVWGDAMLGICKASGVFDEAAFEERIVGDGDSRKAVCTVRRLPAGKPIVREFTASQAKKAGLLGKTGPWTTYPERMLQMRARSLALRDGFADLLRGFKAVEEVQDYIDVDARTAAAPAPVESLADLTERLTTETGSKVEDETPSEPAQEERGPTDAEACAIQLDELYAQYDTLKAVDEVHKLEREKEADPQKQLQHDLAAERRREQLRPKRGQRANEQKEFA